MGFGIEARAKRCAKFWKGHLELSREFQRGAFADCHGGSVAVLGAGRLLDIPLEFLVERFDAVFLVDIDPGATRFLEGKRFGSRVEVVKADVSGSIASWTEGLERILAGTPPPKETIIAFLRGLSPGVSPLHGKCFDAVVSANLLSQISYHWRERVYECLKHYCAKESGVLPEQIHQAIGSSLRLLEASHLKLLGEITKTKCVLLHDEELCYYTRERAEWQVESALAIGSDVHVPNFREVSHQRWFWHIAPQGIEHSDYGVIHVVGAGSHVRE